MIYRLLNYGYDLRDHTDDITCDFYGFGATANFPDQLVAKNYIRAGESCGRIDQTYMLGLDKGLWYGKAAGKFAVDYLLKNKNKTGRRINLSDYNRIVRECDRKLLLGGNVLFAEFWALVYKEIYALIGFPVIDGVFYSFKKWINMFEGKKIWPLSLPIPVLSDLGKEQRFIDVFSMEQQNMGLVGLATFFGTLLPWTAIGILLSLKNHTKAMTLGRLTGEKYFVSPKIPFDRSGKLYDSM